MPDTCIALASPRARWRGRLPALAAAALGAVGGATAHAQFPLFTADGDQPGGRFAFSAAAIADYDGDGVDDVLIGGPVGGSESPGTAPFPVAPGGARLVSGRTGATLATLAGLQPGDLFGYAVAAIGDVDLDGIVDFAIGSPRRDSSFDPAAGSLSVFSGATKVLKKTVFGDAPNDYFGAAVAGLGDTNLDGLDDLAVGAPYGNPATGIDAGRVRILVGVNGGVLKTLSGAQPGDLFGTVVTRLPDVSGDSLADFAVGAPLALDVSSGTRPGRVTVHSQSGTQLTQIDGAAPGDRFGRAVSWLADMDADGRPDLVIGASGADAALPDVGAVSVASSKTGLVLLTVAGGTSGESFGFAVAGLADLNADSKPDFAAATANGRVKLVSGTSVQLGLLTGESGFGHALATGDDANADGRADLLVGSPFATANGVDQAGVLRVYPGPSATGDIAFTDATPLAFAITASQPVTSQSRTLVNTGLGATTYQVQVPQDAPWLKVTPASGGLSVLGDSVSLTFNLDLGALATATASTVVTIADTTAGGVATTLEVDVAPAGFGADPQVCVAPAALHTVAAVGRGDPPAAALTVTNCGNSSLLLSAQLAVEPPQATWVQLATATASVPPGAPGAIVAVSFATAGLAPGSHAAAIRVANAFDASNFVLVPVTIEVGLPPFDPGDKLKGEIADATDHDDAVFYGIDGMAVDFIGGPKGDFKPRLTLLDPDGLTFETWTPANKKAKKSVLLDRAGAWVLRVQGEGGATGSFVVKTKRSGLPGAAKDFADTLTAASSVPLPLAIAALPGAKLDAAITSKTQPIGQLGFTFTLPNGTSFDTSAFDGISGKTYSLEGLPLGIAGVHLLTVAGLSPGAKLKVVFDLTQPKPGKATLTID